MDDDDDEGQSDNLPKRLAFVLRRLSKTMARLPASLDRLLRAPPYGSLSGKAAWSSVTNHAGSPRKSFIVIAVLALFTFLLGSWQLYDPEWSVRSRTGASRSSHGKLLPKYWTANSKESRLEGVTNFKRPSNLSVVGLIFYGRPATVSILDCYLKRNLKANGGLLDEVIFIARTDIYEDLVWLDTLVQSTPYYRRHNLTEFGEGDFRSAWKVVRNDTVYIKIDDDIVFFEDSTIPTIVDTLLTHPEYFTISANIINQPSLAWVHYSQRAVLPFLPELDPPSDFSFYDFQTKNLSNVSTTSTKDLGDFGSYVPMPPSSWRPSQLPSWTGPDDWRLNLDEFGPPYNGHRWLPLSPSDSIRTLDDTPIHHSTFDPFGPALRHWAIGAQQHYSFLTRLEANELWHYKFPVWDYRYMRLGIQFIAIRGSDVWNSMPMHPDDEHWLSESEPERTRRHAVVDGRGIAAHFSFGPQRDGMSTTDLLSRYRAFAVENICF